MFVNYVSVGGSTSSSPEHHHSNYELILNIKGSGIMTIENTDYSFKNGTVILCPPGFVHKKISDNGFKDIFLRFDEQDINTNTVISYDDSENKTVKTLLFHALKYYNAGYSEILNSITKLILTIISFEKSIKKSSPIVEALKSKIIKNFYNTDFKLEETYDKMSYNPDYIRRCFKQEMNMTPTQFLTKLRIENAVKLIEQDTNICISDVAFACGYDDPLYFSKVFKQYKGMSPTQYIKKKQSRA